MKDSFRLHTFSPADLEQGCFARTEDALSRALSVNKKLCSDSARGGFSITERRPVKLLARWRLTLYVFAPSFAAQSSPWSSGCIEKRTTAHEAAHKKETCQSRDRLSPLTNPVMITIDSVGRSGIAIRPRSHLNRSFSTKLSSPPRPELPKFSALVELRPD
jgi:hypothetical protein